MHLSEILNAELEALTKRAGKKKLDIVETGTIRGETDNYAENDGWSTVTFAEWVKKNGGSFTSVDLDVSTAQKVLVSKGLKSKATLIEGHSLDVLAELIYRNSPADPDDAEHYGSIDVAFLDSDNNSSLIFHEYLLVKKLMRTPGLIIVDDVDIVSTEVVKGHEILPWVREHDTPHRLLERSGEGYRTGVLVIEV